MLKKERAKIHVFRSACWALPIPGVYAFCLFPSYFQRFINIIFADLTRKEICLPNMDDLIIPAFDDENAFERITHVILP